MHYKNTRRKRIYDRNLEKIPVDCASVQKAYKVELDPTSQQEKQLRMHCGCARFAYNWALNKKVSHYQEHGTNLSMQELDKQFNAAKKTEFQWAYLTSKCAHQNAIRNLDAAFVNFFQSTKC